MRIWLVVMLVVLVPEGAMAARWEKHTIPVWDMTSDAWRPAIRTAIDDYNTNLPDGAPLLVDVPMGQTPCEDLPQYGRKGGITMCLAGPDDVNRSRQELWFGQQSKVIIQPADLPRSGYVLCHELAHAVIGIPDDYTNPHLTESCVQGGLSHLGPWDIAYAAQVYGEHVRHHHRSRSRHRTHH